MHIEIRDTGGIIFLFLKGEFTYADANILDIHLIPIAYDDMHHPLWIIADITNLIVIDSAGIAQCIKWLKIATSTKGNFSLVHPNRPVNEFLHATNLIRVFRVYKNTYSAVQAITRTYSIT